MVPEFYDLMMGSGLTPFEKLLLVFLIASARYTEGTLDYRHPYPVKDLGYFFGQSKRSIHRALKSLENGGFIFWYPLTGQITVRLLGTLKGAIKIKMISVEE